MKAYTIGITCIGGTGGDGAISFRREKYVPRGGPDGGDGGSGGDVLLVGDASLSSLIHVAGMSVVRSGKGAPGRGMNRTGAGGRDALIPVPVGTLVWVNRGGERILLADIGLGHRAVVARGGRGGRGNARFVSSWNQEPLLAETGEEGERVDIELEVRMIADVALVGQPNAGKSTLLSRCSRARPKIAEYPFTTMEPVLGHVEVGDRRFTLVEIPGLIQGAHSGAGLGVWFLKHAERTRLFIHMVDGLVPDVGWAVRQTMEEIRLFMPAMAERPQIIAVNKVDVIGVRDRIEEIRGHLSGVAAPVFFISAITGEGVQRLLEETAEMLEKLPKLEAEVSPATIPVLRPRRREHPEVERDGGVFVVRFSRAQRLAERVNVEDHRVRLQLVNELRRLGVVKALETAGVKRGDRVRLGKVEIEW